MKKTRSRRTILVLLAGTVAMAIVLVAVKRPRNSNGTESAGSVEVVSNAPVESAAAPKLPDELAERPPVPVHASPAAAPGPPAAPAAAAELAPLGPAKDLIERLAQLEENSGRINSAQAESVAQTLRGIVAQGPSAVPAINEYLDRLKDVSFEGQENTLKFPTLRASLIDALQQIGGPEAMGLMTKTLQNSGDPFEIGLIGKYLEQDAPGQYKAEILQAARESLKMANQDQLQGRDVAPVFQILQNANDPEVLQEIAASNKKWGYYATIALTKLPDNAGVPALVEMVSQSPGASGSDARFAWQMLAQLAPQAPAAKDALLQAAKAGNIPDGVWSKIATGLGGDQYSYGDPRLSDAAAGTPSTGLKTYHISFGNQNFYSLPVAATSPDLPERQAIIDSLLAGNLNSDAKENLQRARNALSPSAPGK